MTKTIVLIHGLWMTPSSWDGFRELYESRGYTVVTPNWPRMSGSVAKIRANAQKYAGLGIGEIVDHLEKIIRALPESPIIMGHSFGGLMTQLLLDRGLGAAGVAFEPAQPRGIFRIPLITLRAAAHVLLNPFNLNRVVDSSFEQFSFAFANGLTEAQAREFYDREVIPTPARPLFQVAWANLTPNAASRVDFKNPNRAPLLLLAGSEDRLVPPAVVRENYRRQSRAPSLTEYRDMPGYSHAFAIQPGWQDIANAALDWAEQHAR